MSGSIGLSTAALTDAEKADVRRFCGYPSYGPGNSGFQGWRFFQAYGLLEYRLTNARPEEFQVIRQYLAQLYPLESAVWGAGANLDTDRAAVWTHNKGEVRDRTALFNQARRALIGFLGLPAGPALGDAGMARVI
jgi:hypothetical protein